METPLNPGPVSVMHIDLNSCFATVEQQAYPHLRGKPVVIAAYTTPGGCILAPSIEAKALGIKTGMRVRDAREICPGVIVRDPDPCLVRDVHSRLKKICRQYSPDFTPKSIDEIVINFSEAKNYWKKTLTDIGKEIKQKVRRDIGEWISCNIGISTNRFLAKLASSLHKPDGLDVITHKNLKTVYSSLKLTDLNGINLRFEARLNAAGIMSPIGFLEASDFFLRKFVFQSIVGHYWYLRLRGYEVDDFKSPRKSFGQDYALAKKTNDRNELKKIVMKLCEKMGRRLRGADLVASGVHIAVCFDDWSFWHKGKKLNEYLYTTQELYSKIMSLFYQRQNFRAVRKISVSCFDLASINDLTINLFDDSIEKKRKISRAMDKINDRYGEYIIVPAIMMDMKNVVLDRIAFGGI